MDQLPPSPITAANYDSYVQTDLQTLDALDTTAPPPDAVLLLDILEHLPEPEKLLYRLRAIVRPETRVIITVPNVAFLPVRLQLLLGMFNYGARGILDHTHLRFYTASSIQKLVREQGYEITHVKGIPAPFPLVLPQRKLARLLLAVNAALIRLHRGLFAFQIGIVAAPKKLSHDS